MKKKEVQKLRLSRETLLELKSPEAQKAVGGGAFSNPTFCIDPPAGDSEACCATA